MKEVGYPQESIGQKEANALIPENPHWESQGAFRHHDESVAQDTELSPDQTIPMPLEEHEEPSMHFETLNWREATGHPHSGEKTSEMY